MCIKKRILCVFTILLGLSMNGQVLSLQNRKVLPLIEWSFIKGQLNKAEQISYNDQGWDYVKVPHTYSMDAINDIGYYKGNAWYRTKVVLPNSMNNERVFIRFEGVGQEAIVYVNGKKIKEHIGGYSAFCYEISKEVNVGEENIIAVKVTNKPNFKRIPVDDALFNHYGGIYRPVQIFSTPKTAISPIYYASSGVFVELKKIETSKANLEVRTHLLGVKHSVNPVLSFVVKDAKGKVVLSKNQKIRNDENDQIITTDLLIENPILWDGKNNPHQYKVDVTLLAKGIKDKVSQYFGIKTFKVDPNKGFELNGKPYRLYGVARHQEWKELGPALTDKEHEQDMKLIEEIGATSLRLPHYQHSEKIYELADKMGLLVWSEIPFVHDYSGREGGNAKEQLRELISQNYNHPSVFVWGLWNEVRAYKSSKEPAVILTNELNKLAHDLDKTRLTTSASDRGMVSNMGNISDLQAWNKYFGWYYGEYEDMKTWLDESHEQFPNRPIGISEYGVGGNIYQQDISKLEKPSGDYFPEMEQSKYHEVTWKILKDRPFVWTSYIWNMFDFSVAGWNRGGIGSLNHKGLITYDRKVKKDAFYFYKANWSKAPVLYIAERRNVNRTKSNTTIKVYTNLKKVSLLVNGKKIRVEKTTSKDGILLFKNVVLTKGENTIVVSAEQNKKKFFDKVVWNLEDRLE